MAVSARIDMALVDKQVFAVIEAAEDKRLPHAVLAEHVGCSPMTIRRAVRRLRAAGRLRWEYTENGVNRYIIIPEDGQP